MIRTSIAFFVFITPLAMATAKELQSYGLRNTPDIPKFNQLNTEAMKKLGVSIIDHRAKILILGDKPHWQEGAIYYHESEFDSWYFTNEPAAKNGFMGFTGNSSLLKYGSIISVKPVREFISKNAMASTFQFNNQTIQATYTFSTTCDNSSDSLPAKGILSISVNGEMLENFEGYNDEINPLFNYKTNTERTCEQFIKQSLIEQEFGEVTFVGDINQDGTVDFSTYTSSKGAYDETLYIGKIIDGKIQFESIQGDSYAPL